MEHISFWPLVLMLMCWVKTNTIKHREAMLEANREVGLEVNTENEVWLCFTTRMQDKIIIY
jgi:hypothetical protein